MMSRHDVLIVGGGQAGAQTAIALRHLGFAGSIAIVGNEADLPYDRPALSKEYLAGRIELEQILLRPAAFWSEQDIGLRLGLEVTGVDPDAKLVRCIDGTSIGYRKLVWATGGAPRMLPCAGRGVAGVHSIRARADVDRIRLELATAERVIVIGGGYLGLEAAAALTEMGKHVVLLESGDRLLTRVAGDTISRFYEAEHRARGVDIRLGASANRIVESAGRAAGVELASGEVIPGDMIIVGIGIVPAVSPLLRAGAASGNTGVSVDAACRTSLPDIYAIGDCAEHPNAFAPASRTRLESVQNANDQAGTVARSILGEPASYDAVPWFWSNQFDLRLQTIGLSDTHDATVLRGDPASKSFSVIYLRDGRVIALDCVNATKDFLQGKALVLAGAAPEVSRLMDTNISLRDLARAATARNDAPRPRKSPASGIAVDSV